MPQTFKLVVGFGALYAVSLIMLISILLLQSLRTCKRPIAPFPETMNYDAILSKMDILSHNVLQALEHSSNQSIAGSDLSEEHQTTSEIERKLLQMGDFKTDLEDLRAKLRELSDQMVTIIPQMDDCVTREIVFNHLHQLITELRNNLTIINNGNHAQTFQNLKTIDHKLDCTNNMCKQMLGCKLCY